MMMILNAKQVRHIEILKKTFLIHEPILQIWIWIRKDPKYVASSTSENVVLDTQHCQKT
jgi:hypothetical protein